MLILPLLTICATALVGIFLPWLKEFQQPSISFLSAASHTSQGCIKHVWGGMKSRVGIPRDAGHTTPPLESSSVPIHLHPRMVAVQHTNLSTETWNGTTDFILVPTESSLSVVSVTEDKLHLVTTSMSSEPRLAPPKRNLDRQGSRRFSQENWSRLKPTSLPNVSNLTPLPNHMKFLSVVMATALIFFNLIVICSWIRLSTKATRLATRSTKSSQIKHLSNSKVVLPIQAKDAYLEQLIHEIEGSPPTSSDLPINILERLYIEEPNADPRLFSEKRWSISKSEFNSAYVLCTAPHCSSVDPSTVVDFHIEAPSRSVADKHPKMTSQSSIIRSGFANPPRVVQNDLVGGSPNVYERPRISSPTKFIATKNNSSAPATVVLKHHVGRTSNANKHPRFVTFENAGLLGYRIGSLRPSMAAKDHHVKRTSDVNEHPRSPSSDGREGLAPKIASAGPSTVVPNFHVERPSDVEDRSELSLTFDMGAPLDSQNELPTPSTVVSDFHVGSSTVVKDSTGIANVDTGRAPESPSVNDEQGDGDESPASVQTAINCALLPPLPLPSPSSPPPTTTTTTIPDELQSERIRETLGKADCFSFPSPATIARVEIEQRHRRRNRMGQRQRRKLRQEREEAMHQEKDQAMESTVALAGENED